MSKQKWFHYKPHTATDGDADAAKDFSNMHNYTIKMEGIPSHKGPCCMCGGGGHILEYTLTGKGLQPCRVCKGKGIASNG